MYTRILMCEINGGVDNYLRIGVVRDARDAANGEDKTALTDFVKTLESCDAGVTGAGVIDKADLSGSRGQDLVGLLLKGLSSSNQEIKAFSQKILDALLKSEQKDVTNFANTLGKYIKENISDKTKLGYICDFLDSIKSDATINDVLNQKLGLGSSIENGTIGLRDLLSALKISTPTTSDLNHFKETFKDVAFPIKVNDFLKYLNTIIDGGNEDDGGRRLLQGLLTRDPQNSSTPTMLEIVLTKSTDKAEIKKFMSLCDTNEKVKAVVSSAKFAVSDGNWTISTTGSKNILDVLYDLEQKAVTATASTAISSGNPATGNSGRAGRTETEVKTLLTSTGAMNAVPEGLLKLFSDKTLLGSYALTDAQTIILAKALTDPLPATVNNTSYPTRADALKTAMLAIPAFTNGPHGAEIINQIFKPENAYLGSDKTIYGINMAENEAGGSKVIERFSQFLTKEVAAFRQDHGYDMFATPKDVNLYFMKNEASWTSAQLTDPTQVRNDWFSQTGALGKMLGDTTARAKLTDALANILGRTLTQSEKDNPTELLKKYLGPTLHQLCKTLGVNETELTSLFKKGTGNEYSVDYGGVFDKLKPLLGITARTQVDPAGQATAQYTEISTFPELKRSGDSFKFKDAEVTFANGELTLPAGTTIPETLTTQISGVNTITVTTGTTYTWDPGSSSYKTKTLAEGLTGGASRAGAGAFSWTTVPGFSDLTTIGPAFQFKNKDVPLKDTTLILPSGTTIPETLNTRIIGVDNIQIESGALYTWTPAVDPAKGGSYKAPETATATQMDLAAALKELGAPTPDLTKVSAWLKTPQQASPEFAVALLSKKGETTLQGKEITLNAPATISNQQYLAGTKLKLTATGYIITSGSEIKASGTTKTGFGWLKTQTPQAGNWFTYTGTTADFKEHTFIVASVFDSDTNGLKKGDMLLYDQNTGKYFIYSKKDYGSGGRIAETGYGGLWTIPQSLNFSGKSINYTIDQGSGLLKAGETTTTIKTNPYSI